MATTLAEIDVSGSAPAPAAPASTYVAPEPGHVAITGPDGTHSLPAEELPDAIAQGYRPATEAEVWDAKHGDVGRVVTAADAVARGATFGLSDAAQVGIAGAVGGDSMAEYVRKDMRIARQANPNTALAGEIAGSLAPLFVTGGAAAPLAAEGALARAGARIVAAAPRAFLEGAALGAGQQLTEDVLENHDLSAQKYLAASLKGGMMGVVIGGAFSAAGGAVGDKLFSRAGKLVAREEGGVYRALWKADDAASGKTSMGRLAEFAEEQAAKGAMPSASLAGSEMQKLGATAEAQQGRIRRIGRTLLDEGITTPGATKAIQAERLTQRAAEVGEELGSLRRSFEKAAARPSAEAVLSRIDSEVVSPLMGRAFTDDVQSAIRPYVAEIAKKAEGKSVFNSFDDLWKLRKDLDAKLKWDKGIPPPTPALKELRAIRGILEDEFEQAAERAAAELGEDVAGAYKVKKAVFSDLKTAEKWATKGAARDAQNRAISLTDTIAAVGGMATMGPQGAALALANKAVRTYGNQVAATIADRATKIRGIQRAAEAFDRKLDGAVNAFFGKGRPPALTSAKATQRVTPEAARALREASRDPEALAARVAEVVAGTGLKESAPRTAQAMTNTVMRAAGYLQQSLPPEPPPRALAFGHAKPRAVGPKAQKTIDNVVRALDADAFVDDLARGRVDRQALEAMKFINPDLYMHVVDKIRNYGIQNAPDLSRQQAVALSIITGQPLTPLMQPEKIRGFQEAYANEEPAHDPTAPGQTEKKSIGGGGPPPGRGRGSRAFTSGTDKIESGDA